MGAAKPRGRKCWRRPGRRLSLAPRTPGGRLHSGVVSSLSPTARPTPRSASAASRAGTTTISRAWPGWSRSPIDGLYLDEVGYDRGILKRMRKVMDRNRPGSMIDLHSNTASPSAPANQYARVLSLRRQPLVRRGLQLQRVAGRLAGRGSGIPFGLNGDMLKAAATPGAAWSTA